MVHSFASRGQQGYMSHLACLASELFIVQGPSCMKNVIATKPLCNMHERKCGRGGGIIRKMILLFLFNTYQHGDIQLEHVK